MKKLILVLFALALVAGFGSSAVAYHDVTWNTVNSPGALGLWPNGLGSPNISEANVGLLGRIMVKWPGDIPITPANQELENDPYDACALSPSHPCAAGSPPVFMLYSGNAEGPKGSGGGDQCNVVVTACGLSGVANAPPNNGPAYVGEDTTRGTYSYYVIHLVGGTQKGIGSLSGSITNRLDPDNPTPGVASYKCNDCPAGGMGKDLDTEFFNGTTLNAAIRAMDKTGAGMPMITTDVNLWGTQTVSPYGHVHIFLNETGPGKASACGNSIAFANLGNDLCVDGTSTSGNYSLPDQKTVNLVYSVNLAHHTGAFSDEGKCNAPDCYVEKTIIPAALAQDPNAKNVMMQMATSVLPFMQLFPYPFPIPAPLSNATVDSLLFYYTTDPLDVDNDGTPDNVDPCPNDPTDSCVQDLINGGPCSYSFGALVFCADDNGYFGCLPPYQCNSRGDVNQDCSVDTADQELVASLDIGGAPLPLAGGDPWMIPAFNTGVPVGPFEP